MAVVDQMESPSRKNARITRGRPFERGNRGRPKGARNRTTLAVEALLDGEAEALTRKAVELALTGDTTALRLCLDRIAPPRKGRLVQFDLPAIRTPTDVLTAMSAIIGAVAEGELTPEEGDLVTSLLERHRRAVEIVEIEARLAKLEAEAKKGAHW